MKENFIKKADLILDDLIEEQNSFINDNGYYKSIISGNIDCEKIIENVELIQSRIADENVMKLGKEAPLSLSIVNIKILYELIKHITLEREFLLNKLASEHTKYEENINYQTKENHKYLDLEGLTLYNSFRLTQEMENQAYNVIKLVRDIDKYSVDEIKKIYNNLLENQNSDLDKFVFNLTRLFLADAKEMKWIYNLLDLSTDEIEKFVKEEDVVNNKEKEHLTYMGMNVIIYRKALELGRESIEDL